MAQQPSDESHAAKASKTADELTERASHSPDPGERAWFLAWARAFRQLAQLGDGERPGARRDH